jgi:hypothetical protein
MFLGTVAFIGLLQFVRRVFELRQERRPAIAVDKLHERLERIELVVESTAVEVERISEANRFMAKLLSESVSAARLANQPERVITPH